MLETLAYKSQVNYLLGGEMRSWRKALWRKKYLDKILGVSPCGCTGSLTCAGKLGR